MALWTEYIINDNPYDDEDEIEIPEDDDEIEDWEEDDDLESIIWKKDICSGGKNDIWNICGNLL